MGSIRRNISLYPMDTNSIQNKDSCLSDGGSDQNWLFGVHPIRSFFLSDGGFSLKCLNGVQLNKLFSVLDGRPANPSKIKNIRSENHLFLIKIMCYTSLIASIEACDPPPAAAQPAARRPAPAARPAVQRQAPPRRGVNGFSRPSAPAQHVTVPDAETIAALRRMAQMHQQGLVSDEEFARIKAECVARGWIRE